MTTSLYNREMIALPQHLPTYQEWEEAWRASVVVSDWTGIEDCLTLTVVAAHRLGLTIYRLDGEPSFRVGLKVEDKELALTFLEALK